MEKRDLTSRVVDEINESIFIKDCLLKDKNLISMISSSVDVITNSLQSGGKILLAGNGGSAADAQHIAGEFISKLNFNRPGLAAIALTVDTSVITAVGNDFGYENIFERQIQAIGNEGDIFWCYSTSGKSKNILRGISESKKRGMFSIGFCGMNGFYEARCDLDITVPSLSTPRIQECHILLGHIICGLVEERIFAR